LKNIVKNTKKNLQIKNVKTSSPQVQGTKKKIQGATGLVQKSTIQALDGIEDILSMASVGESNDESPQLSAELSDSKKPEIEDRKENITPESIAPKQVDSTPTRVSGSRFERALERAKKGDAGPIKLEDLYLDANIVKTLEQSPLLEYYKKLLSVNPDAQPGRPIVNVQGDSETDFRFQLLTLYEMVLAARSLKREIVQVSLVRVTEEEAQEILKSSQRQAPIENNQPKEMTLSEIAETNGFSELEISAIDRDQNIRHQINTDSQEFRNLRESIRSIGLQNPPVVEVRQGEDFGPPRLVCISGHRRLMALEALGVKKVVCALKKFQSMTHRTLAGLAENINREDLHFLDKASGYGQLIKLGMTTAQIAVLLDGDVRTIGKYVRAAQWDESIKARVRRLGSKLTVRYLLNTMAAGERATAELQAMLDRIEFPSVGIERQKSDHEKPQNVQQKYQEFCQLLHLNQEQSLLVKKALKYFGIFGA
jgi:ParB/RepB/Spo0J family partition protein